MVYFNDGLIVNTSFLYFPEQFSILYHRLMYSISILYVCAAEVITENEHVSFVLMKIFVYRCLI